MNISTKFSEIDFLNDLTKATTTVSMDLNIVGNISTQGIEKPRISAKKPPLLTAD